MNKQLVLEMQHLSIGALLGNLEGDFERWTEEGSANRVSLSVGAL